AAWAARIALPDIARGDHVGVALERSIDLIAVMLAVWRRGAVVVPIDPAWPAERRARIAADAQLVTTIDAIDAAHEQPVEGVDPEAIALALYTSGSTGEPKA